MFVQDLPRCELLTPENQFLRANIHRPDPPFNLCPPYLIEQRFDPPFVYIYIIKNNGGRIEQIFSSKFRANSRRKRMVKSKLFYIVPRRSSKREKKGAKKFQFH